MLNKISSRITQPKSQGASQAMLYGTGMTPEDMNKAQVGIASVWYDGNTCNMHLNALAGEVKQAVWGQDLVGLIFHTIGVSDGISNGTEGMRYSLVSREVIADSIELIVRANAFDGVIALTACDKTLPGAIMGLIRLNIPSMLLYGGSIAAGNYRGKDVTYEVLRPNGKREVLLRVPNYDFNWQLVYRLKEPVLIEKGSLLMVTAHYDNSPNNKANPDPSQTIRWGDKSEEEMMTSWIEYLEAKPARPASSSEAMLLKKGSPGR